MESRNTDHIGVIREALEHARELIAAGYESVHGEKLEDPIVRACSKDTSVPTQQSSMTKSEVSTHAMVEPLSASVAFTIISSDARVLSQLTFYVAVFQKLSNFEVDGNDEINKNITVIVGIRHLSSERYVWLPKYSMAYLCVVDLSAQGFDTRDLLDSSTNALLPSSIHSRTSENPLAFVDQEDDYTINAEGGKRIWIMPPTLSMLELQAPFGTGICVSSYDGIDMYNTLPATLLHELSHTFSTGTAETRLHDEKVVPIDLVTGTNSSRAALSTQRAARYFKNPEDVVCMYGDTLCSLAAKRPQEVHKTLSNADSYTYFALTTWLYREKEMSFSEGCATDLRRLLLAGPMTAGSGPDAAAQARNNLRSQTYTADGKLKAKECRRQA